MAIDLGDTVPLTFTVATELGVTPVLTITLPDGTPVTPPVVHTGGSTVYSTAYVTTQSGHHRVSWAGAGAAYVDVFDVNPVDPRFLFSLATARSLLRKQNTDVFDDEELREYMAAVTEVVEDVIGPILVASQSWTADGGKSSVLLPSPATSIVSVTESGAAITAYFANLAAGVVTKGTQIAPYAFLPGQQNVTVAYTVGAPVISAATRLAGRIILKQMWSADQGGAMRVDPTAPNVYGKATHTPSGFLIPNRAMSLLASKPRMPGFA